MVPKRTKMLFKAHSFEKNWREFGGDWHGLYHFKILLSPAEGHNSTNILAFLAFFWYFLSVLRTLAESLLGRRSTIVGRPIVLLRILIIIIFIILDTFSQPSDVVSISGFR